MSLFQQAKTIMNLLKKKSSIEHIQSKIEALFENVPQITISDDTLDLLYHDMAPELIELAIEQHNVSFLHWIQLTLRRRRSWESPEVEYHIEYEYLLCKAIWLGHSDLVTLIAQDIQSICQKGRRKLEYVCNIYYVEELMLYLLYKWTEREFPNKIDQLDRCYYAEADVVEELTEKYGEIKCDYPQILGILFDHSFFLSKVDKEYYDIINLFIDQLEQTEQLFETQWWRTYYSSFKICNNYFVYPPLDQKANEYRTKCQMQDLLVVAFCPVLEDIINYVLIPYLHDRDL